MKKLNLGCGSNKLDGFLNIDTELSCKPDYCCDFTVDRLPNKPDTVDEIVMFHTIEHISKHKHKHIIDEIWRVLKPGSPVIFSYPEFLKCVDNWKNNEKGKKDFWEATLYGRQLYPSDYHVCIMHTPDFIRFLEGEGFTGIRSLAEPSEPYNTILTCVKGKKPPTYVDLMRDHMNKVKFEKMRK